jgi:hypothetical protein
MSSGKCHVSSWHRHPADGFWSSRAKCPCHFSAADLGSCSKINQSRATDLWLPAANGGWGGIAYATLRLSRCARLELRSHPSERLQAAFGRWRMGRDCLRYAPAVSLRSARTSFFIPRKGFKLPSADVADGEGFETSVITEGISAIIGLYTLCIQLFRGERFHIGVIFLSNSSQLSLCFPAAVLCLLNGHRTRRKTFPKKTPTPFLLERLLP